MRRIIIIYPHIKNCGIKCNGSRINAVQSGMVGIYQIFSGGKLMNKQDYISLLNCIYPNFFEREIVRGLPEKLVFHEMILPLNEFDIYKYDKNLNDNSCPILGTVF